MLCYPDGQLNFKRDILGSFKTFFAKQFINSPRIYREREDVGMVQ